MVGDKLYRKYSTYILGKLVPIYKTIHTKWNSYSFHNHVECLPHINTIQTPGATMTVVMPFSWRIIVSIRLYKDSTDSRVVMYQLLYPNRITALRNQ